MMHEELLAAVDPRFAYGKIGDALRAVVKLHKPYTNDMACEECSVGDYSEPYPCPTIRAIEEAIK